MAPETLTLRSACRGDVVVISGHRVGERERLGEILDIIGAGDHLRYRVRWDDGRVTLFYPGGDAYIRRRTDTRTRAQ